MKKITDTELAMSMNNHTLIDYYDRFRILATSFFNWDNLDNYAGFGASRFLEQALYDDGRAVFVNDPELGFLALRANPSDTLNVYGLPSKINAWSFGYNKIFNFDDVVYVMNNVIQKPTFDIIKLFALRLYETERTIDVNVLAQKTPVLIEGDQKTILSLKNIYMQYSGNIPFIFGDKHYNLSNNLNVLNTSAPYIVDKLDVHKHEVINDALTVLGINNANTQKKERLITDEVQSNDQLIAYQLNCFYKFRKQAADLINEKFNLDIDISLNKDVFDLLLNTFPDSEVLNDFPNSISSDEEGDSIG